MSDENLPGSSGTPQKMRCHNCENDATAWCVDCSELVCGSCVDAHQRIKITRHHAIIAKFDIAAANIICSNCTDGSTAIVWCTECVSFICELCSNAHRRIKITSGHTILSKQLLSYRLASSIDCTDNARTNVPGQQTLTQFANVPDDGHTMTESLTNDQSTTSQSSDSLDIFHSQLADASDSRNSPNEENVIDTPESDQPTTSTLSKSHQWFHLPTVLKQTEEGRGIVSFYETKRVLLPKHQKKLVKLILDNVFSIKKEMNIGEREEIARQIGLLFITEKSVSSFNLFTVQ